MFTENGFGEAPNVEGKNEARAKRIQKIKELYGDHCNDLTKWLRKQKFIEQDQTYADIPDVEIDLLIEGAATMIALFETAEWKNYSFWNNLDELLISGSMSIPFEDTANKLFKAMAPTNSFFIRDKAVVQIKEGTAAQFEEIDAHEFQSIAAAVFNKKVMAVNSRKVQGDNDDEEKTEVYKKPANLSQELCKTLLASPEKYLLPQINAIASSPVLYEAEDGGVILTQPGYNPQVMGGVFVTGGDSVRHDSVGEAVKIILSLFEDFDFVTEADRTRRIALLLTPALVQAGLIGGHVPMDYAEASASQSGKSLSHQLITAVYADAASVVTQRNGGVGSFDESLSDALLKGRMFIKLDSLRGRLDSMILENIMTSDHHESVRVRGFRRSADVVAGMYVFQVSTNGLLATRDIMNRSVVVRIRKRPDDYQFRKFDEGDLLDHVRANQGKFLGAVHRIVEDWIAAGKKESLEGRHDFKKWVRKLDWIMSNIFKRSDLMEGHRDIQARTSNEMLVKLRELAFAADKANRLDEKMVAVELITFAEDDGVDLGCPKGKDDIGKAKWLGIQFKKVFEDTDRLRLDEITLVRTTERRVGETKEAKYYHFEKEGRETPDPDPF